MIAELRRLRALLKRVPVLHDDGDDGLHMLWVDARADDAPAEQWSRHVVEIEDKSLRDWLTAGPGAARALADAAEQLALKVGIMAKDLAMAQHRAQILKANMLQADSKITAALAEHGIKLLRDEDGYECETLADAVRRLGSRGR